MPRIPDYLAREGLPTTGGTARGVAVPTAPAIPGGRAAQEPFADMQGATLLERGLESLGAATQQSAETLVRSELLVAQRRRAQDTLDAKTILQDYRQQLGPRYETLLQGDYRTLPEDILREGTQLMQEMGQSLSPQARALFTEDAKQALTVLQYKGIEERTRRRDQATIFAVQQELTDFQEAYARATTPFERAYHRESLVSLVNAFADTGLANPAQLQDALAKTLRAVDIQDVQAAIQANPQAMRAQLLAQTRGDPTREDLPLAPRESLAVLTREASAVYRERLAEQEHAEHSLDRRMQKLQDRVSMDLGTRISEVVPSSDTVAVYDTLLREVNTRALAGEIREAQQRAHTNDIRTLRAVAVNPPQADDPATERRLALLLHAADKPQDFADLHTSIVDAAPRLKVDTWKNFLTQARERQDKDLYSLPGVREGRRAILGGDINETAMIAIARGAVQEGEAIRIRNALDAYTTQVEEWAQTSRSRANADAPALGRRIREAYIDNPAKEVRYNALPPRLRDITDPEAAAAIIRQMPGTNASRGRVWQQWLDAQPAPAQPPPAPPGGTQAAPQRPRTRVVPEPIRPFELPGGTP